MDTDVLIVGAGPTGLMLANQLVRRGVRAMIIDRHAGPSLQTRALGVQARTHGDLREARHHRPGARARQARHRREPLGATGARWRASRSAKPGGSVTSVPVHPHPRPGRQRADHGRAAARLGPRGAVEHRAGRARAGSRPRRRARSRCRTATTRRIAAAWVAGCDGARSAVRELSGITFPGAPYEHVFFVADTEATGQHGAGRGQRLPVAQGFPPVLPDARQGSLAASSASCPPELRGRDDVDVRGGRSPSVRHEAGTGPVFPVVHMVFDLPHPSPRRRALPRPPLLPARRRGAHPQPGRRAGHEHRLAGRLQPGVEARARRRRAGRTPRCSTRTRRSASRSRGGS